MTLTVARCKYQQGLTYVETLLAVVIIGFSAVPVGNALRIALMTSEIESLATVEHFHLLGKMEEVLSQPYGVLMAQASGSSTATSFSDAVGSSDRRLVYIANYDGDNADNDNDPFTGADSELLWIRVETQNGTGFLQALKSSL